MGGMILVLVYQRVVSDLYASCRGRQGICLSPFPLFHCTYICASLTNEGSTTYEYMKPDELCRAL
jgi:hypothetical protein